MSDTPCVGEGREAEGEGDGLAPSLIPSLQDTHTYTDTQHRWPPSALSAASLLCKRRLSILFAAAAPDIPAADCLSQRRHWDFPSFF
ncbi:hypothetical protein PBY51_006340 [Eleginops maclovinus]|uniref:Uncharacterized protein n=1 Tax=Eleginops maclovinus TaxID=56733 RepID=A0AAN7WG39_ELEMC|nr:hypothetical protein PBY51_006340 [Eleginops maclovinus]